MKKFLDYAATCLGILILAAIAWVYVGAPIWRKVSSSVAENRAVYADAQATLKASDRAVEIASAERLATWSLWGLLSDGQVRFAQSLASLAAYCFTAFVLYRAAVLIPDLIYDFIIWRKKSKEETRQIVAQHAAWIEAVKAGRELFGKKPAPQTESILPKQNQE